MCFILCASASHYFKPPRRKSSCHTKWKRWSVYLNTVWCWSFSFIPVENDALEKGVTQPLLLKAEENQQDDENDQEYDGSEEAPEESRKPANSIAEAYRLLTPSVKVSCQLWPCCLYYQHVSRVYWEMGQWYYSHPCLMAICSVEVQPWCVFPTPCFLMLLGLRNSSSH